MEKTNYVYYNYLMRFVEKSRKEKRSGVNYSLNMLEVADKAIEKYVKEYLNKDDINGKAIINGILRDHIFNYTSYANTIEDLEENKSTKHLKEPTMNMYACIALLSGRQSKFLDVTYRHLVSVIYDNAELKLCSSTIGNHIRSCAAGLINAKED